MKRHLVGSAGVVLALTAHLSSASIAATGPPATPAPGTLLIVAGTGQPGFSGDGGPATQAQLSGPFGLAFDAAGNLYIAEIANARVRKVTPAGAISTAVGGGKTSPRPVNGIPATQAKLGDAHSVTFDGAGNLFLSGFYSARVWKVSPDGLITTVAGGGTRSLKSANGGPATQAQIASPAGLAADAAGNLLIGDFFDLRVLTVTADGILTTAAGGGNKPPQTADGGPATAAQLQGPWGVAIDAKDNLFIADNGNYRVRRVSPDGIITTVAGNGTAGSSGDGGPATQAQLNFPNGLAVDSAGNLFIAEEFGYRVRKVTPDGIITTVAGTGKPGLPEAGVPASSTSLRGPVGLTVDAAGNLFIADTAWVDQHLGRGGGPASEHVLEVVGAAAPGLIAGQPFPKP